MRPCCGYPSSQVQMLFDFYLSISSQPTFVFCREATSKDDFVCSTFHTSVTFITLVSIVTASLCLNPLSTYIYSIVHLWGPLETVLIKTTILNPNFLHSEKTNFYLTFCTVRTSRLWWNSVQPTAPRPSQTLITGNSIYPSHSLNNFRKCNSGH